MDCPLVIFDPRARKAIGEILKYPGDMREQMSADYFEGDRFIEIRARSADYRINLRLYYAGLIELIKTDLRVSRRTQLFITPENHHEFYGGPHFRLGAVEIAARPARERLEDPSTAIEDTREMVSKVASVVRDCLRPKLS